MKIITYILMFLMLFINTNLMPAGLDSRPIRSHYIVKTLTIDCCINLDPKDNITIIKILTYNDRHYYASINKSGYNGGVRYNFPSFLTESQSMSLANDLMTRMTAEEPALLALR